MSDRDLSWWREVSDLFAAAGRGEADPGEALRSLQHGLALDAALLTVSDSSQPGKYRPVVNNDYDPTVAEYLASQYVDSCPGYAFALRTNRATRIVDTPFDFKETRTYAGFLGPAGFREGITVPFTLPWTGQRGFLAASSASDAPASDGTLLGLTLLSGALAGVASPALSFANGLAGTDVVVEVDQLGAFHWLRPSQSGEEPIPGRQLSALARHLRVSRRARGGFRAKAKDGTWLHVKGFLCPGPAATTVTVVISAEPPSSHITERELDVLALVCRGMTNIQIASALFISLSTVKSHIEALLRKIGLENRSSLVAFAAADDLWSALYILDN
jgi:DNA-binding CsgD family transcriptional regulator